MANPTKERIKEIVHEVLGYMIVDEDTVNHDVIGPSTVEELVNKLHGLTNG